MKDKQHAKINSGDDWMDPLYLNELLTEEEKSIKKTTKDFCKSNLQRIWGFGFFGIDYKWIRRRQRF